MFITLFGPVAMFYKLTILCRIFLTFRLNDRIFYIILSVPQNITSGLNNIMLIF
jgi:hypothetical protein